MANEPFNNPFWQGIPYAPETLPPEVLQQLEQRRSLMGGAPQQLLGSPPMQIQVPDIQYSPAMKKQALSQALMTGGMSLLAAMKPTALPQSPLANIGEAGLAGMGAYQGNLNNKMIQGLEYAKMQKAMQPDKNKEAGTVVYDNKRWQWNPTTSKYDIPLGKAKEPGGVGLIDFGDKELVKKTLIEMPKLKKEATTANNISTQIDRALDLMKGDVTGKGGQIKSFFAPYAEMLGVNLSGKLDDAQTFQLLTRAIIGPMRLEIVGPGPVSEWEQKLMQQISGGGGASKQAASELLSHWKKLSESKINNYNDTLEGLASVYPKVKAVYKPISGIAVPGSQAEHSSGGMTEAQARQALSAKGITGPSADEWIKKYRAAGKIQ